MAHPKRCIDFLTSNYDSWYNFFESFFYLEIFSRYFGITTDGVPDGLGILGLNNEIRLRGVFQNGKLNGIGRSQSEKGDIHDGIFIDGELNIGKILKVYDIK